MAYSQQTTHYGLPLPTSGDKSTFLDTNDAFGRIDSDIYEAKTNATAAVQDIGQIQLDVSQLKASTLEMQTDISQLTSRQTISETNITALQSAMTTAQADVTKLQNDYGSTDISDIGDGTVTGAIHALATGEYVTVTRSTGTNKDLINDLAALIDHNKITSKSYLIFERSDDLFYTNLAYKAKNRNLLRFTNTQSYPQADKCALAWRSFNFGESNSNYMLAATIDAAGTITTSDISNITLPEATTLTLYY